MSFYLSFCNARFYHILQFLFTLNSNPLIITLLSCQFISFSLPLCTVFYLLFTILFSFFTFCCFVLLLLLLMFEYLYDLIIISNSFITFGQKCPCFKKTCLCCVKVPMSNVLFCLIFKAQCFFYKNII